MKANFYTEMFSNIFFNLNANGTKKLLFFLNRYQSEVCKYKEQDFYLLLVLFKKIKLLNRSDIKFREPFFN